MSPPRGIRTRLRLLLVLVVAATVGCRQTALERRYLGEAGEGYYRGHATAVEFPNVWAPTPEAIQTTLEPHTVREREEVTIRPISLQEAIFTALQNAQVVRTNATFLSPGNPLLENPNFVPSVYDPAIQETGVLFGNRGVEAALAAFDANFTTSLVWGRNETNRNSLFSPRVVSDETASFQANLSKTFANGAQVQLQHNVDYLGTTAPGVLFPSSYTGNLIATYRHPLWAGSGVEFTRIAGPIGQSFGGITGVSQGVVIARINQDLTIAQFEGALHDLVLDVENAYWDLYLAYRNFNTACELRDAAQGTWELADKQAPLILLPADEAQARDQLFAARAAVNNTRSQLFTTETRLRRLLNLPVNDGTILQPSDEPVTAEIVPDWYAAVVEALASRVELRAQKWNIRSLELQLAAAKSLTKPRLDFVASAQINGFGDQLFPHADVFPGGPPGLRSMYERIAAGSETGWSAGLQMNIPIGFRLAIAQVRNYELRVAKARKVLAQQEQEITHELAVAFQELARAHAGAVENFNRYQAAVDNVEKLKPAAGATLNVDVVLRAQERRAQAEVAYFTSLIEYNKALANLHYRKGMILAYNSVHLREGPWVPEAYEDARRRFQHRSHSFPAPWKETIPDEFVVPGPVGHVTFTTEAAATGLGTLSDEALAPLPGKATVPPSEEYMPPQAPQTPPGEVPPPSEEPLPPPQVRSPLDAPPLAPSPEAGPPGPIQQLGWWPRSRARGE